MKNAYRIALAIAVITAAGNAFSQADSLNALQIANEDLAWVEGNPPGYRFAVPVGNPTKAGLYVMRMKLPVGFKYQPHSHPDQRVGTVLAGTLMVGYGDEFDESRLRALGPGSIWTEPARAAHFLWAKDGEVVIQMVGTGPSATIQAGSGSK